MSIEKATFDAERFAELLKTTEKENFRTQAEFARACQFAPSYLNKFIRQKSDRSPKVSTIRHIAESVGDENLYRELMEAAGYDPSLHPAFKEPSINVTEQNVQPTAMDKKCAYGISFALTKCNFKYASIPAAELTLGDDIQSRIDWGVEPADSTALEKWFFEFMPSLSASGLSDAMQRLYNQLLYCQFSPKTKFSIVVCDEKIFDQIEELPSPMLNIYLSIILLDKDTADFVKEEYIQTALELTDEMRNVYTLSNTAD